MQAERRTVITKIMSTAEDNPADMEGATNNGDVWLPKGKYLTKKCILTFFFYSGYNAARNKQNTTSRKITACANPLGLDSVTDEMKDIDGNVVALSM